MRLSVPAGHLMSLRWPNHLRAGEGDNGGWEGGRSELELNEVCSPEPHSRCDVHPSASRIWVALTLMTLAVSRTV